MKYSIGAVVIVRDWDDMVQEFGTVNDYINVPGRFYEGMECLCGEELVITELTEHDRYKCNLY